MATLLAAAARLATTRGAAAVGFAVLAGCASARPVPVPGGPARTYQAPFTSAVPSIRHGGLESGAWAAAPWTADFVDIEGPAKPAPAYRTRAKMLWDERNLYVGAELAEPHVWGTLTKHDQIVFHDNDFEVFIDPDGDTREYYEIEVNALGTIFDLYLHQTYRAGGPAIHGWNCAGLATEIDVQGTPNNPRDMDRGWTVQLTIPWAALQPPQAPELAGRSGFGDAARRGAPPSAGATWRVNFSRVQWRHNHEQLDAHGARVLSEESQSKGAVQAPYTKVPKLPEDNWVWSPQWTIDMHLPQFWGHVTFVR